MAITPTNFGHWTAPERSTDMTTATTTEAPPPRRDFTMSEAAGRLGVSEKTLTRWRHAGLIRVATLPTGRIRVPLDLGDRLLAAK